MKIFRGAIGVPKQPAFLRLAVWCFAVALTPFAAAHELDIRVAVQPLQPTATYSKPATADPVRPATTNYLGYAVSISNLSDDRLDDVHFVGSTQVTAAGEAAVFASATGATCTPSADGKSIDCAIGPLGRGQAFPTFTLFFATPVRATSLPAGDAAACTTTDCVSFSGQVVYTERPSYYRSEVESQPWRAPAVALALPAAGVARSAVPSTGLTLATGDGGVSLGTDLFTTQIVVPAGYVAPSGSLPTAEILESPDSVNCSALISCFRSNVTVPGTFSPYLTVVLRVDATNIKRGTKIGSVLVSYEGLVIGDCASPTTPRTDGIPCIAKRVAYPVPRPPKRHDLDDRDSTDSAKKPRNAPSDLDGDFEWTLINLKNGSYKVF